MPANGCYVPCEVFFLVAIVGVLLYQIWKIGLDRLLHALPSEPAFYVLLLAMYFSASDYGGHDLRADLVDASVAMRRRDDS